MDPKTEAASASSPRYVVVGCLTTDSVVTATGELIRRSCGGNALYAAVGVHIWDRSVGIVARTGSDYPTGCLGEVGARVDLGGLRHIPGPHPIHVAFAYRPDGSRVRRIPDDVLATIPAEIRSDFVDTTGDDARYLSGTPSPADIPPAWLADVEAVHLPALLVQSHAALVDALRTVRPDRLITVDTPWLDLRNGTSSLHPEILEQANVVLPSEDDLALLMPRVPLLDAARRLIDNGARAVVVKLGPSGSIVVDGRGVISHVPAYPASAVDPTGAGDSFCGGFLVGLRETGDLVQAAIQGTVSASFVVEDRHAIPVFDITRTSAEDRRTTIEAGVRRDISADPRRSHE
ncbi:MAG TPA: carbohydrate kinase family protein [Candidatus Acidoferrum sp.]|nr:carbohydrate kinase family protein [Candidatus Acidoferrum sp.]